MSKLTKKPITKDSNQPAISQFYGIKDIKKRKPSDDRFKIIEDSFSLYKKDDEESVEPLAVPSDAELQEFNNAKKRDKDLRNKMDSASIEEVSELTTELLENDSQLKSLKEKAKKSDLLKSIILARNEAQECVQHWKSQDGEEAIKTWSSFHVLLKRANGLLSLYDDIQSTTQ